MTNRRSFGMLALAIAAAAALGAPASAQPAASKSDSRGPLVQVQLAPGGGCAYLWNGRATAESQLLESAVGSVEGVIRRLGGVENVTAENFPAANLRFSEDAPWRCVRGALETVGSAGFMELRIADPGPAAAPWANPLVFEILPPPEPDRPADEVHNRVGLDDRGILTWNGAPIDLVTLRQYCDVTQTMDPLPSLRLDIDGQASYRDTGPILGILWRARVQRIDMSDPGRRGDGDSGLRLSATSLVR